MSNVDSAHRTLFDQQLPFQCLCHKARNPARSRLRYAGNEKHVRQQDGFVRWRSRARRFGTIDIAQNFDSAVDGRALLFVLLWFEVANQLKSEWSLNPQYAYGWTVPFIALYLISLSPLVYSRL